MFRVSETYEKQGHPPQEPALAAWWRGPTLVQAIDAFRLAPRGAERPLRMPVSDVFKGARGGIAVGGKLEAGALKVRSVLLSASGCGHKSTSHSSADALPRTVLCVVMLHPCRVDRAVAIGWLKAR